MKKKIMQPRDLLMAPSNYEITLTLENDIRLENESAGVEFKFGETGGTHYMTKAECLAVSKWFGKLSAALK